jgi:hypothetical protein
MSDTCYSELRCRRIDQERFEDEGFGTDNYYQCLCKGKLYIEMYDDQCNYGAQTQLQALAAEGIPFYGSHGSGDEYPAAVYAAADGEIAWPPAISSGRLPVVEMSGPGQFSQSDLDEAEKYFRLLRRAQELLGDVDEDTDYTGDHPQPEDSDTVPPV